MKQLRFRRQDVKGFASHILEQWEASYGALYFTVTRRPKRHKYWPGPGVTATASLGHCDPPPFRYKAKDIEDAKHWCRGALCYILRGQTPFGRDDNDS
jgi:hypothetical protein